MTTLPASTTPFAGGFRTNPLLLILVVLTFAAVGYDLIDEVDLLLDEDRHYSRIEALRDGTPSTVHPSCCLHTYHAILASVSRAVGVDTPAGTRLLSLLISLMSVPVVYRIVRILDPRGAALSTAQYFFLPVLLPFFFLVYTDALALFFVLLGVMFALDGVIWAAALVSIMAVLVRQTHVIWMGFVFLLPYLRSHGIKVDREAITEHLRKGWLFLVGFVAFFGFVAINKGVAIGDSEHHPAFEFRPDNIWFALFVVGVVFLPLHISNLPRIGQLLRRQPWWLVIVGAAFSLFWFGTSFDHPYNHWDYCLHNKVLNQLRYSEVSRTLFFLTIAGSLLSLAVTPMKESSFYLVYPLAALSLAPSWMVDVRYALPTLALFVLFRTRQSWKVEWANLAWTVMLSSVVLEGTARKAYFL